MWHGTVVEGLVAATEVRERARERGGGGRKMNRPCVANTLC